MVIRLFSTRKEIGNTMEYTIEVAIVQFQHN